MAPIILVNIHRNLFHFSLCICLKMFECVSVCYFEIYASNLPMQPRWLLNLQAFLSAQCYMISLGFYSTHTVSYVFCGGSSIFTNICVNCFEAWGFVACSYFVLCGWKMYFYFLLVLSFLCGIFVLSVHGDTG